MHPGLTAHTAALRRGRYLEYITIGWNTLEALVSTIACMMAGLTASCWQVATERRSRMVGADPVAALIMIPIIGYEGVEALRESGERTVAAEEE